MLVARKFHKQLNDVNFFALDYYLILVRNNSLKLDVGELPIWAIDLFIYSEIRCVLEEPSLPCS